MLTQVATLAALRMLVRVPAAADPLDAATRWRVNVGAEFAGGLARALGFEMEEYLVEEGMGEGEGEWGKWKGETLGSMGERVGAAGWS